MISGDCPYCDAPVLLEVPEVTPVWGRVTCDACGREYWEYYDRLVPCALSVEEFDAAYVVDEERRMVWRKVPEA